MPQSARQPQNGLADTFFHPTPRISPSSLAFFVSGFAETMNESTSGFKHLISVRASKLDYIEHFSNEADAIIAAVTSFMSINWPADFVLNAVALPVFSLDASSFYGLTYYRSVTSFNQ